MDRVKNEAIEAMVEKTKSAVAQRWPDLDGPFAAAVQPFAEHLRVVCADGELENRQLDELALAFLCARQEPKALALIEQEFFSRLATRIRRVAGDGDRAVDVVQMTRERLLVRARDGRLRILDYSGRGSLLGWVQVTATRLALNQRRSDAPERYVASDDVDLVGATADPALQLLKERHRADFKRTFAEVIAGLSPQDRALLRMHHVDNLTMAQIGVLVGLDKANVSRRLMRLRERLFDETRQALARQLRLASGEFESLMDAIGSQLDVSLSRILVD